MSYVLRYKEFENVNKPSRIAEMVCSPFKSPEKLKQYVTSSNNWGRSTFTARKSSDWSVLN